MKTLFLILQLLYTISGNGVNGKSYLLATHATVDQDYLDTIPGVYAAFGRCNKVITEFAVEDYEALSVLRTAALLPDSVKLTNFYSDAEYQEIADAILVQTGLSMSTLARMKPSYLTEMVRTELFKRWLAFNPDRSIESFFEVVAASKGIPVYGLDEVGETMYMLFDREPFEWQCKELQSIIETPELEIRQERTLIEMYKAGRLTDIAYQISGPDNHTTLSYSDYQIWMQRNRTWVKRLDPYLKEGKVFITLHAAYLGGDQGLIALLRAQGYKIKAIR